MKRFCSDCKRAFAPPNRNAKRCTRCVRLRFERECREHRKQLAEAAREAAMREHENLEPWRAAALALLRGEKGGAK